MTIQEFIRKRKHLAWYVKNVTHLDEEAIVEAVLNYGDWKDVQGLIKILGIHRVARIFRLQTHPNRSRINYHPKTKHFFSLYFKRHARGNIN